MIAKSRADFSFSSPCGITGSCVKLCTRLATYVHESGNEAGGGGGGGGGGPSNHLAPGYSKSSLCLQCRLSNVSREKYHFVVNAHYL